MLDKLFGWGKKKETPDAKAPSVVFGRYSDNNKTLQKTNRWSEADNLFKEKKYHESIAVFFDYLGDDAVQNVTTGSNGAEKQFSFFQGSKIVRGTYNNETLRAEVTLAAMAQPSVPVMRRLLEQNFNLYYSRYALDADRLCMRFDTDIETANPNKLYYAFKELATKADKQDDLLIKDFSTLQTIDSDHVEVIPDAEKETKYKYLMLWIEETLNWIEALDAEKLSGGIAHLLLNLAYRIDFLIVPEGKLLHELENLVALYFAKDEKPVPEKNKAMISTFKEIMSKPKEEVFPYLFRSKHTFSIAQPQVQKTIADTIYTANQNMIWYRDNNYPHIAQQVSEYGLGYCQYNFSLPKALSDLYLILMKVRYADFFKELGFTDELYNSSTQQFNKELIEEKIQAIIHQWKEKFPNIYFKKETLKYDSILSFTHSFTSETEFVNTESK
jgi:hypothetical protein